MWNNLKPLFVAGRCTAMGPVGLCLIVAALANAAHALPTTEELHLEGAPSQEEAECLQYLHQNMPEADINKLAPGFLFNNVVLALKARTSAPWAQAIPWQMFLDYVLPYAQLDEPRDAWRPLFTDLFMPLVAHATSSGEAAQILNRDIWKIWGIVFKPNQTPSIMSPTQVIEAGYASCTGLSIFLADACRAVGIPARVVGTPSWVSSRSRSSSGKEGAVATSRKLAHSKQDLQGAVVWRGGVAAASGGSGQDLSQGEWNNHNWVEVWDGKYWSFMGSAEFDARGFNRTWFFPSPAKGQVPGDRLHAIYAASFAPTPGNVTYPLVWDESWKQPGLDVTQAYLDAEAD